MECILILPLHPKETDLIILSGPNASVREKASGGRARKAGGVAASGPGLWRCLHSSGSARRAQVCGTMPEWAVSGWEGRPWAPPRVTPA